MHLNIIVTVVDNKKKKKLILLCSVSWMKKPTQSAAWLHPLRRWFSALNDMVYTIEKKIVIIIRFRALCITKDLKKKWIVKCNHERPILLVGFTCIYSSRNSSSIWYCPLPDCCCNCFHLQRGLFLISWSLCLTVSPWKCDGGIPPPPTSPKEKLKKRPDVHCDRRYGYCNMSLVPATCRVF